MIEALAWYRFVGESALCLLGNSSIRPSYLTRVWRHTVFHFLWRHAVFHFLHCHAAPWRTECRFAGATLRSSSRGERQRGRAQWGPGDFFSTITCRCCGRGLRGTGPQPVLRHRRGGQGGGPRATGMKAVRRHTLRTFQRIPNVFLSSVSSYYRVSLTEIIRRIQIVP